MGTGALAQRVGAGDRDAFAEMYREFSERVYGLCFAIVRDRDEAADATQDVFVVAVQRIAQLRDPDRLTPWLFAVARHVCFRRLAERRRLSEIDIRTDLVVLDEQEDETISPEAAATLVWAAAEGLNERDRTLLYLNTREGLTGADLAAAVGVKHANPYSLLTRAKAQLARALEVLVVARVGRRDCDELSNTLAEWDGNLTPILRKRLARHVDACENCQRTKAHIHEWPVLATALTATAAQAARMTAPDLLEIASRRPVTAERWQRDGFPPALDDRRKHRALVAALVAAVGVLLLAVALKAGDETTTHRITMQATATHSETPTTLRPTAPATSTSSVPHTTTTRPVTEPVNVPRSAPVAVPPTPPRAVAPTPTTRPRSVGVATTVPARVPVTAPPKPPPPPVVTSTTFRF